MDTRRSFIKKAGMLTGAATMLNALPPTLAKALAIDPAPGSTFYDAEHVVFLMQENRSFDHAFGSLQGVRGYNDPRAIQQPNGNKVWLQSNEKGETFVPFPLDIKNSNITWMGSLPHSWTDQVDARNGGKMNKWLDIKDPGGEYTGMPITLGYFNRADIPFYYSLADAFTVCDHNFCSVLAGTTPNRLYFWSGTIREEMKASSEAKVWNQNADHGQGEVHWKTYPERLEDAGISWKVYQNELYLDVGLEDKQGWLDNYGDNPLEYFTHYHARMSPEYIAWLPEKIRLMQVEISGLEEKKEKATGTEKQRWARTITSRIKRLNELKNEQLVFTKENYEKLSDFHKNIHQKAFTTNRDDPNYHQTTKLSYNDGTTTRELDIPKGDVLHQFRKDVNDGSLPTVSWLAAPQHFSDHPSSAWFGAWYVSEVMDILTKNPEVWKKTIFVLTYDENDGYFDHIPPYTAPNPYKKNTGKTSPNIDTTAEYVRKAEQSSESSNRESAIGLGYRVPMVIASPWSRGGFVCSEVFDHTSSLQFLEIFLEKKTGKKIVEKNMTQWRRTVCGNLTSAFRPYNGEKITLPQYLEKEKFIQSIHEAQYKHLPNQYRALNEEEVTLINDGKPTSLMPQQEKGTRFACALPYQLYVHGGLMNDREKFEMRFEAANNLFGKNAVGTPFYVYEQNKLKRWLPDNRDYALSAGSKISDEWLLADFENHIYHLKVYGPNGFYRSFQGHRSDPKLLVECNYEFAKGLGKGLTGNLHLQLENQDSKPLTVTVNDLSYKTGSRSKIIPAKSKSSLIINLAASSSWYDVSVQVKGFEFFEQQFAGHIETGQVSKTDPLMGGLV